MIDLLNYDAGAQTEPSPDVEEICDYIDALAYARRQLSDENGLLLSMRLLNETHRLLMKGVRGADKRPGVVRRRQNWVGGSPPGNAVFVPPHHHRLPAILGEFEKYMHGEDALPRLIRTGLLHVQFETIHPYLDGNGRIGRLLITLLLEHWGLQERPLTYLSLFFKRNRAENYRRLDAVRSEGDWEGWLDYSLEGVAIISEEAIASVRGLFAIASADRNRVHANKSATAPTLRLSELLLRHPIVTVATAMNLVNESKPTATRAIGILVEVGILAEVTGRRRDRILAYKACLDRLKAGTDLAGRESWC